MRGVILTIAAALFATLSMTQGASAAPLGYEEEPLVITDDFNAYRGRHTVGNGWRELEAKRNYVTIKSRKAQLAGTIKGKKGADAAIMSSGRNMSKFTSFEISFDWKALKSNERSDKIYVSYSTDPNANMKDTRAWTTLFKGGTDGKKAKRMNSFSSIFDFEAGVDLSNVKFMIWTDVTEGKKGKKEGFLFDNFIVTGLPGGEPFEPFFDEPTAEDQRELSEQSLVATQPVPVPASLPLLLAGLGAFGYCAQRRRTASSGAARPS